MQHNTKDIFLYEIILWMIYYIQKRFGKKHLTKLHTTSTLYLYIFRSKHNMVTTSATLKRGTM